MLTISLAALLASTSPADSFPVTNLQIAGCTQAAVAENRLSDVTARRIQTGTVIYIGGRRTVFRSGDSIWNLCDRHLERRIVYRELNELERELAIIRWRYKPQPRSLRLA